jgi:hypothetical protein
MKLTQTWGWLAAGVLAAGLNASYHDGGLEWAHRVANRVEEATSTMRDLSFGRTDLFLTEARLFLAGNEDSSSPLATVLTRVHNKFTRTETQVDRLDCMTAHQRVARARAEAQRDRMEAQRQRMEDQMEAQRERTEAKMEAGRARLEAGMARLNIPANFAPMVFNPPQPPSCLRVRVSLPRMPRIDVPRIDMPRINISAPAVRIEAPHVDPI